MINTIPYVLGLLLIYSFGLSLISGIKLNNIFNKELTINYPFTTRIRVILKNKNNLKDLVTHADLEQAIKANIIFKALLKKNIIVFLIILLYLAATLGPVYYELTQII